MVDLGWNRVPQESEVITRGGVTVLGPQRGKDMALKIRQGTSSTRGGRHLVNEKECIKSGSDEI